MSKIAKIAALVLILASGAIISACGEEDRSHLLPGNSVQEIEANINTVQEQVNEGLCLDALSSAADVQKQAESLPRSVDSDLKKSLIDGAVTLIQLVRDNCDETGATTTDEPEEVETEPEVTPTGDTGSAETDGDTTGSTGKSGQQNKPDKPTKPKPNPKPTPTPEPTPPVTPEPPPTPDPPVDPGPGSGGITP